MIAITITLHIDAAAAVRAGSCAAGPQRVQITQEDLHAMTPAMRTALANHLDDRRPDRPDYRVHWGDPLTRHEPPIGVADIDAVRLLLVCRALRMAQQAARDALDQSPIAVQRRIVDAIRAVDPDEARRVARRIADGGPSREEALVLAAAVLSRAMWDAASQLRQIVVLEERPAVARDLRNPNPIK